MAEEDHTKHVGVGCRRLRFSADQNDVLFTRLNPLHTWQVGIHVFKCNRILYCGHIENMEEALHSFALDEVCFTHAKASDSK